MLRILAIPISSYTAVHHHLAPSVGYYLKVALEKPSTAIPHRTRKCTPTTQSYPQPPEIEKPIQTKKDQCLTNNIYTYALRYHLVFLTCDPPQLIFPQRSPILPYLIPHSHSSPNPPPHATRNPISAALVPLRLPLPLSPVALGLRSLLDSSTGADIALHSASCGTSYAGG